MFSDPLSCHAATTTTCGAWPKGSTPSQHASARTTPNPNPPTCLPVSGGRGIPVLKQIGKFITEPLRKGDKSRPLRWRMGMRLNHIHNDLHSKHPKLWNAVVM